MKKKGIFIAATGQNIGKTTTSLAILQRLIPKFPKLSFMKPVGQRTMEVDGEVADEDVILMRNVFKIHQTAKTMSPITVPAGFTKDYLNGKTDNSQLRKAITEGWEALTADDQPVIVEGTGHTGVGSVFDMNNAQVAKMLDIPAILVAQGGIGRPIDEIALNLAMFEKENVPVLGVVLNKTRPDKREQAEKYCSKYLNKLGIKVLGAVEFNLTLSKPSLRRLHMDLKAEILSGHENLDQVPTKIMTGAAVLDYILDKTSKRTLVVTPASRSDVIMAAAFNFESNTTGKYRSDTEFTGLFLTGDQAPNPDVLKHAKQTGIPILWTKLDVFEAVEQIDRSLGKTLATDLDKLELIRQIYGDTLDWDSITSIVETGTC